MAKRKYRLLATTWPVPLRSVTVPLTSVLRQVHTSIIVAALQLSSLEEAMRKWRFNETAYAFMPVDCTLPSSFVLCESVKESCCLIVFLQLAVIRSVFDSSWFNALLAGCFNSTVSSSSSSFIDIDAVELSWGNAYQGKHSMLTRYVCKLNIDLTGHQGDDMRSL
uniref:Uncharacterized protein n=1 Tax=Glossina austeni TaxID=7395 RepID=A0A1A9VKV7_GLOAU